MQQSMFGTTAYIEFLGIQDPYMYDLKSQYIIECPGKHPQRVIAVLKYRLSATNSHAIPTPHFFIIDRIYVCFCVFK